MSTTLPYEGLLEGLFTAGIFQFGHFIDLEGRASPVSFQLELLPAYPRLLHDVAEVISEQIKDHDLHRLLCDQESLPLAVCVSQRTRIPLVYEYDHRLAGAYDVGHPAALIGNLYTKQKASALDALKLRAQRTGLEIIWEVYLLGLTELKDSSAQCLIQVNSDLLDHWVERRWITRGQRVSVEHWLAG